MLAPLHMLLAVLAGAALALAIGPQLVSASAAEAAATTDPGVSSVVAGLAMLAVYVGLRSRRRR